MKTFLAPYKSLATVINRTNQNLHFRLNFKHKKTKQKKQCVKQNSQYSLKTKANGAPTQSSVQSEPPFARGSGWAVSRTPQKGRHLFIVKSQRWEQLVDVYCGDLRAVYQKASAGETQSTWRSAEIFIGNGGAPAESVPPAVTACRASTLLGSFGFVMTSEQGSVMLTFDPEEWTTGKECRAERSTETFSSRPLTSSGAFLRNSLSLPDASRTLWLISGRKLANDSH